MRIVVRERPLGIKGGEGCMEGRDKGRGGLHGGEG